MKVTMKFFSAVIFIFIMVVSLAAMSMLISISENAASAQTGNSSINGVNISQVGVRTFNNAAEFGPITIGMAFMNGSAGPTLTVQLSPNKILQYKDRNVFPADLSKLMTGNRNLTLKSSQTVLSTKLQSTENLNYVGVSLKRISTNNSKDNHAGIVWNDGNKEYYAFLRPNALSLYVSDRGEVASVSAVHPLGKWDTIRVANTGGVIHVFLNNIHMILLDNILTSPSNQKWKIKLEEK
jgi:hypothetical protein